jgi:hypothetical protein
MSITFGYFLLLVQSHQGSLSVSLLIPPSLLGVFVAEEVEGVGHKVSRRYHNS